MGWLALNGQGGARAVYRVETAGGAAPVEWCALEEGEGERVGIPYAALYWFCA